MFIIKNKIFPIGPYAILNIFGILFTKRKRNLNPIEINHETIHTYLMFELFSIGIILTLLLIIIFKLSWLWLLLTPCTFYIWYGIEYLITIIFNKSLHDGYHDISLEEEAYNNEDNLLYLKHRKLFNWLQYLKIKSYVDKQR